MAKNSLKMGEAASITDVLYEMSLNGWCVEETGDVSENGHWYGRLEGPWSAEDLRRLGVYVRTPERRELASCAGAILTEDQYGFKDSSVYRKQENLDKAWSAVEAEVGEYYDQEEE